MPPTLPTTLKDLPADADIEMVQKDTWSQRITIKVGGTAYDITGSTFYFTIESDSGTEIYSKTITALTDPENGIFTLTIPKTSTSGFSLGTYNYDLVWELPDGTEITIMRGTFKVTPRYSETS